jgi:hypothetical protein
MEYRYDGFKVIHMNDPDRRETPFRFLDDAMRYCETEVGNASYAKPFPNEDIYAYGPGDGTASHMIRRRRVAIEKDTV